MVRWEPGAAQRLRSAALDLYASRGFEQTTVTEIAGVAGVSERTFFRHFADKREVLFAGGEELAQAFVRGVVAAPDGASPFELVAGALATSTSFFPDDRRSFSRQRQSVIDANPGLRERELLKLAHLATTVGAAMRERGVPEPAATLAAEAASTVFRVSYGQWIAEGEDRALSDIEQDVLRAFRGIVGRL